MDDNISNIDASPKSKTSKGPKLENKNLQPNEPIRNKKSQQRSVNFSSASNKFNLLSDSRLRSDKSNL